MRARSASLSGTLLAGAWLAATVCAGLSADERITRIDGVSSEVHIAAIRGDGVVLTNSAEFPVTLEDLWQIERAQAAAVNSGLVERVILDHGEIPARGVTVRDGVCRFDWAGGSGAGVTQAAVRALILETGADTGGLETIARALEKRIAADQVVAVGRDNVVLTIEGVAGRVGTNAVEMQYRDKDRILNRARVSAVVFGRTGMVERTEGPLAWKATIAGGAWLEGSDARLDGGVFTITIGAGTLDVPWTAIHRVEHRGRRVRFLSQMNPLRAAGGSIVALALPWQRDRSAMNRPLRLRGKIHDTGLGVHAPSELVFEAPEGMQRFMAVVALDEEFGQGGDCVVVVQVGDREAFRRRMRGSDRPVPVDVRTEGGRQIALRVEPGENLDIGDHVNWYDARLLQ